MIRFIKGVLAGTKEGELIVENNGIGFAVSVPLSVMELLPPVGSEMKIYTYFHVREDAMQLFGFLSQEDLHIFELLITVNGIGPKVALGLLGSLSANEIRYAVAADDDKTIARAPGIGSKTARKLILELKDKLTAEDMIGEFADAEQQGGIQGAGAGEGNAVLQDAVEALVVLGYSRSDAVRAARSVEIRENTTVEEVLKQSLKHRE